jgi:hypothetical protein
MAKLVEILAKELNEWKEDAHIAMQDNDSEKTIWFLEKDHEFVAHDGFEWKCDSYFKIMISRPSCLATDYKDAIVTRAQWQAERDRQKGGEWKRHRGGKQPVDNGVYVEARLRCGEFQKSHAQDFIWPHNECDHAANLMEYRVISQLQAMEVDMRLFNHEISMSMDSQQGEIIHGPIKMGETVIAPAHPKWHEDQIDGPIKWREREALINRLEAEGFALIQKINVNLDKIDATLDMSDWRNWKAGDVLESMEQSMDIKLGGQYILSEDPFNEGDITFKDDAGDIRGRHADEYKFIRRP